MTHGIEAKCSPPPALQARVINEKLTDQLAEKTANALISAGGKALEQVGARAKKTFMGLSVDSIKVPTFIKDKIQSIGTSKAWKSLTQYCVRINESWGTVARWGMGGALIGSLLFGSTLGAAFGMGAGGAVGLYNATSTWLDVTKQQEQADQDAAKLQRYMDLYGDINPDEPYQLIPEHVHN
ncbi:MULTISPECIES: hypothetical protein [unclassified Endozoicomonas]|uniref:hypothetical protein n=1 Tax=unclassified Endozoicomonas TaxID=2644528 RepID=UPI0021480B24|nr:MULTISPECIES: hypothetical protein [unclassified Endozoicomonas]